MTNNFVYIVYYYDPSMGRKMCSLPLNHSHRRRTWQTRSTQSAVTHTKRTSCGHYATSNRRIQMTTDANNKGESK